MTAYHIERIANDHPQVWTACFQACAVARCRETSQRPWACRMTCEALPTSGSGPQRVVLAWADDTEQAAEQAERTYQEHRLTEEGAAGVCAACLAILSEGEITEVTKRGSGVDYWVDGRRAVLEISGLREGTDADLALRHEEKGDQLRNGSLYRRGVPGYVFVVLFARGRAHFSYHRQQGVPYGAQ